MNEHLLVGLVSALLGILLFSSVFVFLCLRVARQTDRTISMTIWDVPSGAAALAVGLFGIFAALTGYFVNHGLQQKQDALRLAELRIEVARAFEAEVFSTKLVAIAICEAAERVMQGHYTADFGVATLNNTDTWANYSKYIGHLPSDAGRSIASFYALRSSANATLNNDQRSLERKFRSMQTLIDAADLIFPQLQIVSGSDPAYFTIDRSDGSVGCRTKRHRAQ